MEHFLPLIIQLVSGLVGGHAAGAALNNSSLGPVGNSLTGLIGGGVLGQIIQTLVAGGVGAGAGGLDLSSILTGIAGGGAGGALLTVVAGVLKNMLTPKS